MAKAYDIGRGDYETSSGLLLVCIEGPKEFIEFASKRLSVKWANTNIQEPGDVAGTIREYFEMQPCERTEFMSDWRSAKAAAPEMVKHISRAANTEGCSAIEAARAALKKAESALNRAITRSQKPNLSSTSSLYYVKAISSMRGNVRRAHRHLIMTEQEEKELEAFFSDKACQLPRQLIFDRVPYKDPFGREVSREQCRKAAEEHWAVCVKALRLGLEIGAVTVEHAEKMFRLFGSLEAYLSFMRVGDLSALRLPVIEKALAQLDSISGHLSNREVLDIYELATRAVEELATWMEMINAMYHKDILRIVKGITEMQKFQRARYDLAVSTLQAMRAKLMKPIPRQKDVIGDPFTTISVCEPDGEQLYPPETAA